MKSLGTPLHKALIRLLIEKRREAGLSQTAVAKRLGEHQSFVARLEGGQRRVDVVEFLEISRALKFDAIKALQEIFFSR